jgi:hypothetical protein
VLDLQTKGADEEASIQSSLDSIHAAINVQMETRAESGQSDIPFVPFNNFDTASAEPKTLLFGPSGSGKSRSLVELLRHKISSVTRLYIINPSNASSPLFNGAKAEVITLDKLVSIVNSNDGIIWDNFPDDLAHTELEYGLNVLAVLASKADSRFMIITLKPQFLEVFANAIRRQIPSLYSCEIKYSKEIITEIIKKYGQENPDFRNIYLHYIKNDLNKIAAILWEKEPIPLTVIDYYKELAAKSYKLPPGEVEEFEGTKSITRDSPISPIDVARNLLRANQYYDHQFQLLSSLEERRSDTELLYVLRLSYELGLNRNPRQLASLRQAIFRQPSNETDQEIEAPNRLFHNWIFLSCQNYCMHDVAKDAVRFNDQALSKIIGYLVDNFSTITGNQNSNDKIDLSSGAFFGRNVQFLPRGDEGKGVAQSEVDKDSSRSSVISSQSSFLPRPLREYMRDKLYFQRGLAQGIGQIFYLLDQPLQHEILEVASFNPEFSNGLGGGLGSKLQLLDSDVQSQVFESAIKSPYFARGFGESLGLNFVNLPDKLRSDTFSFSRHNIQFADGLGQGIGKSLSLLEHDLQRQVTDLTEANGEFARGVGWGLGYNLNYLEKSLKSRVMEEWVEQNMEIARGVAMGIGRNFKYYDHEHQVEFFEIARRNVQFAEGLGIELAFSFSASLDMQRRILAEIQTNIQLAEGLGIGLGYLFTYLDEGARNRIFTLADINIQFADGLGYGIGISFSHLHQDLQKTVYAKAAQNLQFAIGFGFGLGYMFAYMNKDMQKQLLFTKADSDVELAKGLGNGIGYIFKHLPEETANLALGKAEENPHFAIGLGTGFGYTFAFTDKPLQDVFFHKAEKNIALAEGLGVGIGRSFRYFNSEEQREMFAKGESDGTAFARGLGFGLGYTHSYYAHDANFQQLVFKNAEGNKQFAIGLGNGIGYAAPYNTEQVKRIIQVLCDSPNNIPDGYLRGLGLGVGYNFYWYFYGSSAGNHTSLKNSSALENEVGGSERSEKQRQLKALASLLSPHPFDAKDLDTSGEDDKHLLNFVKIANRSSEFWWGFGEGIGKTIEFIDREFLMLTFDKCDSNKSFAAGLGVSVGELFRFMKKVNGSLKESILNKIKVDIDFAQGFGFGLARSLSHMPTNENNQDAVMEQIFGIVTQNPQGTILSNHAINASQSLSKGFGHGAGLNFHCFSERVKERLLYLTTIDASGEYANSLARGIGHNFKYLQDVAQAQILEWAGENGDKMAPLAEGIGRNIVFLSTTIREQVLKFAEDGKAADSEFAYCLARGVGHCFPSLSDEIQSQFLQWFSKRDKLANGLTIGIKGSLQHLNESSKKMLIEYRKRSSALDKAFARNEITFS